MESVVKGGNLMLFVTKNSKLESIALATSHTLRISADTQEVSNKDVAGGKWSANEVSQFSWEASTDNLYSEKAIGEMYDLLTNATPVDAVFCTKSESDDVALPASGSWTPSTGDGESSGKISASGFKGKVLITSLEVTATNGENATFSATFTGYGKLERISNSANQDVIS